MTSISLLSSIRTLRTMVRITFKSLVIIVVLYTSFTLIRTTLYVAHGSYISLYNIQESQWLKHVKFPQGQIYKLIKCMSKGKKGQEAGFDVTVLLENGQLYTEVQDDLFADQNRDDPNILTTQTLTTLDIDRADHFIHGEIIRTSQDQQKNEWFYIMTRENMQGIGEEPKYLVRLFGLYFNKCYEIYDGLD